MGQRPGEFQSTVFFVQLYVLHAFQHTLFMHQRTLFECQLQFPTCFYMQHLSCASPSVRPSVRPSIHPSIRPRIHPANQVVFNTTLQLNASLTSSATSDEECELVAAHATGATTAGKQVTLTLNGSDCNAYVGGRAGGHG